MRGSTVARGLRLGFIAAFVTLQASAPIAGPVLAAATTTDDLSVSPGTLELFATAPQQAVSAPLTLTIAGPTPAQVSLSIADAVAAPNGGLAVASLGTTAWTLDRIATVAPTSLDYVPNGSTQTFTVTVTVAGSVARGARAGIITSSVLEVVPSGGGGNTLAQGIVVNTPVVAAPDTSIKDAGLVAGAQLTGSSLVASPSRPWLAIDQVVPDLIPSLVNHGPMAATARVVNTGNTILRTETVFSFSSVPLDAWFRNSNDPGTEILRTKASSGYALPGQTASFSASSAQGASGQSGEDALPTIGIVRIAATTSATIGGVSAPTLVQSQTVLVFPWKEALAALFVVAALFPLIARGLRALWRAISRLLAAPLRPFRALAGRLPKRDRGRAQAPKRGGDVDEDAIAERLAELGARDAESEAMAAEAAAAAEAAEATGGLLPHMADVPVAAPIAVAGAGFPGAPALGSLPVGPGEPVASAVKPLRTPPSSVWGGPNDGSSCTI